MGPGEGGDGEVMGGQEAEQQERKARRGRAPEPSWPWARGRKERVRNQGRGNQRSLRSVCRAWQRDAGHGREMPTRGEGAGEELAGQCGY